MPYGLQALKTLMNERDVPGTGGQVSPSRKLSHWRVLHAWFSLTMSLSATTDPQTPSRIAEHPYNMVLLLFQSGRRKLGVKQITYCAQVYSTDSGGAGMEILS